MNSDTMLVLCRKCRQKIALPMGFDSPVFLCPRCQTSMRTPPEVMLAPPVPEIESAEEPTSEPPEESLLELPTESFEPPPAHAVESHLASEAPAFIETSDNDSPDLSRLDTTDTATMPDLQQVMPSDADRQSAMSEPAAFHNAPSTELELPQKDAQAHPMPPTVTDKDSAKAATGGKRSYASSYAAKGGRAAEEALKSPKKTMATQKKAPARNIRRELVDEIGESALVGMIKEFYENEVASQPITRPQFLQKLMKKGLSAEVATEVISYAQNSPEGKAIALGTSWTTFYWGLAAIIGGVLLNIITVATTGYIVKYFILVPMLGFIAVVNSGQKILTVSFPMFSKTSIQAMIFLVFLLVGGMFFYFTVLK